MQNVFRLKKKAREDIERQSESWNNCSLEYQVLTIGYESFQKKAKTNLA